MKLRTYLLIFGLAVLVPMIAFAVMATMALDRQQRQAVERGGIETARALRSAVDRELGAMITTLQTLGTARSLERDDLAAFYEDARRVFATRKEWNTIILLAPSGQLVIDLYFPYGTPLPRIVERESLDAVLRTGRPVVGPITFGPISRRYASAIRVPIVRNGAVQYVLTGVLHATAVEPILHAQEVPADWVATVFDGKGTVVARTRAADQFVGRPVAPELLHALGTAGEGWMVARTLEGVPVYTAFSRSPATEWGVALGIPLPVVEAPVRRSLWTIAASGLGLLLLATGVALVLGRRLARDLDSVSAAVTALGRREPVHVAPTRIAELDRVGAGVLAASAVREAAERALRENEARLGTTLASIGDGVIATDLAGRVTFLNPAAAALTGWTEAEAAGADVSAVFRIVNEHTGQPAPDPVARVLKEGLLIGLANDTLLLSKDGRQIPIEDTAAPVRVPGGALTGVVLVFHDASARRQALAEFRVVANAAPVLIWMARPAGGRTFVNLPWLTFTGRSLASELGDGWAESVHPDDRARALAAYRATVGPRQAVELEYRLRRHDGEYRWILERGVPRVDPNGRFTGYIGSCLDITERRRGEAALRELAAIVDSSDDAIVSKNIEGLIQSWNAGAERLFGYPAREVIGRPITVIIPPDRVHEEEAILARILRGERVEHFETVRVAKDGREVDVSLTVSPVKDATGQVVGASKIARDITGRKRAERDREEFLAREQAARAEADAASRAKDDFLAMLGHELRNPLGAVSNAVMALELVGPASEDAVRLRGIIGRQTQQLTRLMEDLLDVARVTAGKVVMDRRPVDLKDVAAAALQELREGRRSVHQPIAVFGTSTIVDGDPMRLRQVVANLVDNALKYTPAGGRIEVSVGPSAGWAVLRVKDSGIGIAPDLLPRIFDLFAQGGQALDRPAGGLGVGLALAKRLVELHGGTIVGQSGGAGAGSEFTVRLPLSAAPMEPGSAAERRPGRAPRRRVLIVEDHRDTRESLRLLLELEGHAVDEAVDGEEGLERVLALRPDLALVDIGLPGVDGYALARRVRSTPEGRSQLLVAVTGYGQPEDRRRAFEAGFDAHVVKPLDRDKLVRLLSELPAAGRGVADRG